MKRRMNANNRTVILAMLFCNAAVLSGGVPTGSPTQVKPKASISTEGYGKAKWGMSFSVVKKLYPEISQLELGRATYFFLDRVLDKPAKVVFDFADNKLVSALVHFQVKHNTREEYHAEYFAVQKALIGRYGKPSFETVRFPGADTKQVISGWDREKTFLTLTMAEHPISSYTQVVYSSKEFGELNKPGAKKGAEKL